MHKGQFVKFCSHGHEIAIVGRYPGGACKGCCAVKRKGPRPKKQFCLRGHNTFICGRAAGNGGCNTCIKEYNEAKMVKPEDLQQPHRHTIETANKALTEKELNKFLTVISIVENLVTVLDAEFGTYQVDLKALAPSTQFPLHRKRKHVNKLVSLREKYVGKLINGMTITDIFYGKDRGYKNRSFMFSYTGICGHSGTTTYAHLTRWKKSFVCASCSHVVHGERTSENGVLKPRTPTYNFWVGHKEKLPQEYQDYEYFKTHAGEKPFKKADIALVDGKPVWVNLSIDPDNDELNLIAMSIRQAFRHSLFYKECLENARVETENGVRYRCAVCNDLARRNDIQVDHIESIAPLDGSPLQKEGLIDRIWTKDIQVLDKKCHLRKSNIENKQRKNVKNLVEIGKLEERLKSAWTIEEEESIKKEISKFLRRSVVADIRDRAKKLYNIVTNKIEKED